MEPIKKKKSIPKPTHFGANLKLLRRLGGMSQKELASKLNLTRNKIASYELGLVEPKADLFLEASNFFNVDSTEMLSSVFTDNLVESMKINEKDLQGTHNYIIQAIENFIEKTNEMNKIMNGYKTMADLKQFDTENNTNKKLYRAHKELLELFEMLIQHNWETINQIITYDHLQAGES